MAQRRSSPSTSGSMVGVRRGRPRRRGALRADPTVLATILASLSLRERLVVCLTYADGLSIAEIAAVLDTGVAEVDRILRNVVERVGLVVGRSASA